VAARIGALLPLASLFSRFEALRGAPRVAGAIGAAALAVGVSASGPATADSLAERPARPQLATVVARAVPTAATPVGQVSAPSRTRSQSQSPLGPHGR